MNSLYKFINGRRVKALVDKECATCKNLFSPKSSENKYCSRECYYEMKRIRKDRVEWTDEMRKKMSLKYSGKGNPSWGKVGWSKGKTRWDISGENHWKWKGGYSIDRSGYKVIQNNKETLGKKVTEHRKIWIETFGEIPSGYVLHHKNKNKLDNRIKNLELVSRSEHIAIHRDEISGNSGFEIENLVFSSASDACLYFGKSKTSIYRLKKNYLSK